MVLSHLPDILYNFLWLYRNKFTNGIQRELFLGVQSKINVDVSRHKNKEIWKVKY